MRHKLIIVGLVLLLLNLFFTPSASARVAPFAFQSTCETYPDLVMSFANAFNGHNIGGYERDYYIGLGRNKLENGKMGVGINFIQVKTGAAPHLVCTIDVKSINDKNQVDCGRYLAMSVVMTLKAYEFYQSRQVDLALGDRELFPISLPTLRPRLGIKR